MSRVVNVGVTAEGEMDVPDGKTSNVGWYQYGTVPGEVGSAVIGAHVYAAFSKLRRLKAGSDIYIVTAGNKTLHFVVDRVKTYALADLSPEELFNSADGKHLNLITCSGSLTRDRSTYDHRLVAYATLVE
jgi:LPXTG-site transpeptidase (sortase) family protein